MGCWHHYGPSCGWPPPPEWADVYRRHRWVVPWEPDEERRAEPERWRRRGSRRERDDRDVEPGIEALEARARDIRAELERIETDIERLAAQHTEGGRS
jgi:hypothetical protein